eukprot:CAMPEP_0169190560 /NCGR_PEP_ID=MMETSP1016-20121227/4605_1 /TAXON_ID=342587 /ORGANISM="Karlodinium micrum, Strain CCMP2283" /LENGTH=38 /DNA_ID= /DNA_START= /DNA_END= /DNA_ORIENTATION=
MTKRIGSCDETQIADDARMLRPCTYDLQLYRGIVCSAS